MKGLRFERIATGRHYNVVFHIGSTYVPVSDETIDELKEQSLVPAERFLDLLIDRVGYSSYLKDQIRNELKVDGRSDHADYGAAGRDPRTVTQPRRSEASFINES